MKRLAPLVAAAGVVGGYVSFLRPQLLTWGTTAEEVVGSLPGDDIVAEPDLVATRAIGIRAPADRVWPWVVQLGQGRGGFYSYDWLENLARIGIHSADRIVPEWQHVAVGDEVRLAEDMGLAVALVEPGRALVLHGAVALGSPPYDFTWAFVLVEQPDGTTRLIVRERYAYTRWWTPLLVEPVEVVSFVMHEKMLRGIRNRAEGAEAR